MTKRSLFVSFAAAALVLGSVGTQTHAGQVTLPSALSALEATGAYAIVGNLEFSDFTYTPTPMGSPPPASAVTVSNFGTTTESGVTFNGAFFAAAGTTIDYALSYKVTALSGTISDALLSGVIGNFGGTCQVSIAETIFDPTGTAIGSLEIAGNKLSDTTTFASETSITVQKDMILVGGSQGATISFVNQGFSGAVPEPSSMALLGIGAAGFLAFRRFFKRTSVA
jgi:hypothetical protein